MPYQKKHDAQINVFMPAALLERMEGVAPAADGARSRFVREAIEAALERAERKSGQASDSAA
jgi:metal-responsive CopG/Arc/MetJ family transcriptional regulator